MPVVRLLIALVLLLTVTGAQGATLEGVWVADVEGEKVDLSLSFRSRGFNQHQSSFLLSDFVGLDRSLFQSTRPTPASFAINRDAGTIRMEGNFTGTRGSGHFTFLPSEAFGSRMNSLGYEDLTDRDHFLFAVVDFGAETLEGLRSVGIVPKDRKELMSVAIHRVTPEYVREMKQLGVSASNVKDWIAMRIHGVTPAYVREMRSFGWDLDGDDLVGMRIHGVTAAWLREMKALGLDLDADEAKRMRIHGVTPEYIEEMRSLGVTFSDDQAVEMRIHGVTPDFVRKLRSRGYETRDALKLTRAKIHGLDRMLLDD
ncbi:MAG TPA: hypothetical protein VM557_02395 [Thermoanaerobaculia bacterium]|nr:hypothetical protein [Thermoanaerobaculia bacterium]